jgi:hypothetical protein
MTTIGKVLRRSSLVALVGAATLLLGATDASARIVCNQWGECWHVRNNYAYQPTFGLVVHEDNWRFGRHDHFRWREHAGRGYWRHGVWVTF